ncbi:hypothetical protein C8Q77DRAFT_1087679 [Trametes polyzona]|nr:hypothetical protein C8Q77DRAFT_1087679 [Trametes polyzona]
MVVRSLASLSPCISSLSVRLTCVDSRVFLSMRVQVDSSWHHADGRYVTAVVDVHFHALRSSTFSFTSYMFAPRTAREVD